MKQKVQYTLPGEIVSSVGSRARDRAPRASVNKKPVCKQGQMDDDTIETDPEARGEASNEGVASVSGRAGTLNHKVFWEVVSSPGVSFSLIDNFSIVKYLMRTFTY